MDVQTRFGGKHARHLILALGFMLLASACIPEGVTPTPATSLWGTITTFGQAEQSDAPAIWPEDRRLRAVWIGADESGIHQIIRAVTAEGLSDAVNLALPSIQPRGQQVIAAGGNNLHMLWMDDFGTGEPRLYDAMITPDMVINRGPTLVSSQSVRRYVAIPTGDGALSLVSSGGLLAEPGLFLRFVDSAGRPRLQNDTQIAADADWPTFVQRNDGTIDLLWLANSDGRVFRGRLLGGELENPQPVTSSVSLQLGDRLDNFSAGLDSGHIYLFWNLTRADGQRESWFTVGALDAARLDAPTRLSFSISSKTVFASGFNSGDAQAALSGRRDVSWVRPLAGQFDVLPVAGVEEKNTLVLLYFKNGTLAGYQAIAPISNLLGAPNLMTDRDRHLYLAWAEPNATGTANLNVTMTRHL